MPKRKRGATYNCPYCHENIYTTIMAHIDKCEAYQHILKSVVITDVGDDVLSTRIKENDSRKSSA